MEGTLEEVPLSGEGKASRWCRPSFCWFVEALTWKPAQIKTKGLVSSLCLSQSMRSDADFWKDSMWFDAGASIVKHVASFLHFAGSLCFPCVIQTASLEPLQKKKPCLAGCLGKSEEPCFTAAAFNAHGRWLASETGGRTSDAHGIFPGGILASCVEGSQRQKAGLGQGVLVDITRSAKLWGSCCWHDCLRSWAKPGSI